MMSNVSVVTRVHITQNNMTLFKFVDGSIIDMLPITSSKKASIGIRQ